MIYNSLAGYYTINGKTFHDKIEAILFANSTKSDIEWSYYNDVFYPIDWSVEPETSLREFYKIRAEQLRDKYDYLIAFVSGGADSCQVVESFVKNHIKLDEVYAGAPLSGLKNFKPSYNIAASNHISETFYAQLPFLEKLRAENPEIKITVNDYFDEILRYKEDDWLFRSSDWLHPTALARYSLEKFDHIKKLVDKGKRVAAIYGANKPQVFITNNVIMSAIDDLGMNVAKPAFKSLDIGLEPFYTTPDLPLLVVKQSHEVIKYALKPENEKFLKVLKYKSTMGHIMTERSINGKLWNNATYGRAITPVIYPDLNYNYWQSDKPNTMILADHDAWFYEHHKDTRAYKMMISDVSNFVKTIDYKYFKDMSKSAFKTYSIYFPIGNIYGYKK